MYRIQLLFSILIYSISSSVWATEWFKNPAQQAEEAFIQKSYEESANLFTDSYQRGVALYRNGQYAEAAKAFATVTRPETKLKAQYNLGNAYFQQGDYQKAIKAYEKVLAEHPTDENAKHNLELAKQLLEKSQQQQSDQPQDSSKNEEEQNADQQQSQADQRQSQNQQADQNTNSSQKPDDSKSQVPDKQSTNKAEPQDKQTTPENPDSKEIAQSQSKQQAMQADTDATSALPSEDDVMAEVLLNRLEENPQRLLRGQFYLDARRSEAPPPDKSW